jgi:hypothetical protein
MAATNERTRSPRSSRSPATRTGRRRTLRRHEDAVIQAEVRRLARALAPYRVLQRDARRRTAGAESWHEGGFERALAAAVEAGRIERLSDEFYAARDGAAPDAA